MGSYEYTSAGGNATQHNGNVYNNSTHSHHVHNNQLGQPNPFTKFLATQAEPIGLHKACAKGDENEVRNLLLHSTKDLEAQDDEWMTPLQLAVYKNKVGVVRVLLDFGANIEARCNMWAKSQKPIFLAVLNGNEDIVRLLIESGIEIEERNATGLTPLCLAAKEGFDGIVAYLADNGANLEVKDAVAKWTPLWWATNGGHASTVLVLMQRGARVDAKDRHGRSIFDHVRHKPDMAELLKSRSFTWPQNMTDRPASNSPARVLPTLSQAVHSFIPHTSPWSTTLSTDAHHNRPYQHQNTFAYPSKTATRYNPIPNGTMPHGGSLSMPQSVPDTRNTLQPSHPCVPHNLSQSNMSYPHANVVSVRPTGGYENHLFQQHSAHAARPYTADRWGNGSEGTTSKRAKSTNLLEKILGRVARVL